MNSKIFFRFQLRHTELGAIVNRDLSRRTSKWCAMTSPFRPKSFSTWTLDLVCGQMKDWKPLGKRLQVPPPSLLQAAIRYCTTSPTISLRRLPPRRKSFCSRGWWGGDSVGGVARDEEFIKVLDRLLFYLRTVHSVDYYNHCEYPYEDEMPNRYGIM